MVLTRVRLLAVVGLAFEADATTATACSSYLSASDPKYINKTYNVFNMGFCEQGGLAFPANRTFTLYTRPSSWNPLATTKLTDITKHQYYLVDPSTGNRWGDQYYLTTVKTYNTPHFPKCLQANRTEHPKFVTSCIGRCGAGCGPNNDGVIEDGAGVQHVGVGYTSTDYGAGKDAYKRCHVGCWMHDACIYALLCPKSVQWIDGSGAPTTEPAAVKKQCNAALNPSIIKCGALEYGPLRRECTTDSKNPTWPSKQQYKTDCVDSRIMQEVSAAERAAGIAGILAIGALNGLFWTI